MTPASGAALLGRLRSSYADLIGPIDNKVPDRASNVIRLTLGQDEEICRVRPIDDDGTEVYQALVKGGPPEAAGEDAGRALGSFYWDVQRARNTDAGPAGTDRREGFWATPFFAGAAVLSDVSPRNDWWHGWLTGADLVGIGCAIGSVGAAVHYRNAAEHSGDAASDTANVFVGTAFACIGLSVTARILGTLLESSER